MCRRRFYWKRIEWNKKENIYANNLFFGTVNWIVLRTWTSWIWICVNWTLSELLWSVNFQNTWTFKSHPHRHAPISFPTIPPIPTPTPTHPASRCPCSSGTRWQRSGFPSSGALPVQQNTPSSPPLTKKSNTVWSDQNNRTQSTIIHSIQLYPVCGVPNHTLPIPTKC